MEGNCTTKAVVVRGKTLELVAEQKSKAVWTVTGTYKGRHIQVQARNATAAVMWRERAQGLTL